MKILRLWIREIRAAIHRGKRDGMSDAQKLIDSLKSKR